MRTLRVVLYCLLGGLPLTVAAMSNGGFAWWWLSGIVLAAAFVPLALFGPRRGVWQFAVIWPFLMIVTVLCLWSEAVMFFQTPENKAHAFTDLIGAAVSYTVIAVVLAVLAALLKLPRAEEPEIKLRSAGTMVLLVLVSGLAYVLYYLVFGSITYQFFTKGYYPDAPAQVAKLGIWFWVIQLGRGVLMSLVTVPVVRTLRMTRMQAAVAVGLLIWVAGGLSPLLLPNPLLGPTQRFIHTIEILTQNLSLGMTAVLLFRPKRAASVSDARSSVTASA
jgi:hypothetical protein